MTNREKYLNKILASHLLQAYCESELVTEFGVKCNEDGSIEYNDVVEWLQSEYEEPKEEKIEYIEVTNDIPRFTEIEVRNDEQEEWVQKKFLCTLKPTPNYPYPYSCLNRDGTDIILRRQARIRKDWENK